MLGCKSRDTKPELAIRRLVHAEGLRYRVAYRPEKSVRRSADLVFTRRRVAVFVDGCFWHACPQHYVPPKTNSAYWTNKIEGNARRDRDTDRLLSDAGWRVVRVWEHEDPRSAAAAIVEAVRVTSTSALVLARRHPTETAL